MRSSIITPTPPPQPLRDVGGKRLDDVEDPEEDEADHERSAGVSGTASTESVMPATSSTTMAPGSLRAERALGLAGGPGAERR